MRMNRIIREYGILPRLPTQGHLRDHDGNAQNADKKQIGDQKRKSAVTPHEIRELPEVSQADGRTGGSQDKAHLAGPFVVCFHKSITPNNVFFFRVYTPKAGA